MSSEKRRVARIAPFVTPCRVTSGARRFAAYVADLSARGARVTCDDDCLSVGDEVVIDVKLGKKVAHVHLPGTVAWVRIADQGAAHFGVRFDELSPDDEKLLGEVLQEFQRLAARLS